MVQVPKRHTCANRLFHKWRLTCVLVGLATVATFVFIVIDYSTVSVIWRLRSAISRGTVNVTRTSAIAGLAHHGITYVPHPVFARWPPLPLVDMCCGRIEIVNLTNVSTHTLLSSKIRLPFLKSLVLDNTDVTDDEVAMIYGCRKLCRLRLNKTSVTSGGVSDFVTRNGIADLEELSLGSTTTDDGVCRILPSLHQLRIIDLFGTHVTDKTAHVISILRNVEVLSVSKSLITADGVGQFPRMPGLKKLYVSGIRTLSDIAMFSTMDSLEYLDVAYTSVDDRGVGALPRFACLRSLVLDGCEISDESIPLFLETTHLVSLSLRETRMSRLGVAQMKSERPAMKCWNDWVP